MKIYTKTGDAGTTALFGGSRVPKHHIRIEAYGTVDELNSYIGLVADLCQNARQNAVMRIVQDHLFTLGAILAHDPAKPHLKRPDLEEQHIEMLESEIDWMDNQLPPMTAFILPGGHPSVSHTHIARTVCRRAERITNLMKEEEPEAVPAVVLGYLNRLSDYLFNLARLIGKEEEAEEIKWLPQK